MTDEHQSLTCKKCGMEKPADEFNRDALRPTGRKITCKRCVEDKILETNPESRRAEVIRLRREGKKSCTMCMRVLPLNEFHKASHGKAGQCRVCLLKGQHARRYRGILISREEAARLASLGLKRCGNCKETLPHASFYKARRRPDGLQAYCKKCMSQQESERYRADIEKSRALSRAKYHRSKRHWPTRDPRAHAAHVAVAKAIRNGVLVRPDRCAACGGNEHRIEGHHDDYGKPLEVVWLCSACHHEAHVRHDAYTGGMSAPTNVKPSDMILGDQQKRRGAA